MKRILITAERDYAIGVLNELKKSDLEYLNLPLEKYRFSIDVKQEEALIPELKSFKFVIYGGMRNARYFLQWMNEKKISEMMRKKIHLVMDQPEANLLEEKGIPAIQPREDASPIDLMEFLLRINVDGGTLYPCAENSIEEMPGLLQELEMPVAEFTVCKPVPMDKKKLEQKRKSVEQNPPDAVLFHSRGSVVRTQTAFPDLDLSGKVLVSASAGVTQKMYEENLSADYQAEGSWNSVLRILKDQC